MHFTMRLGASLVLTLLLVGGWAISLCCCNGLSSIKDKMASDHRGEELNAYLETLRRRSEIRAQVTAAVIAEEMDLHEAAAEFRRTEGDLEGSGIPPMDREESYHRVIVWVHSELQGNTQVANRAAILARLDRDYIGLFGHPPVLSIYLRPSTPTQEN